MNNRSGWKKIKFISGRSIVIVYTKDELQGLVELTIRKEKDGYSIKINGYKRSFSFDTEKIALYEAKDKAYMELDKIALNLHRWINE